MTKKIILSVHIPKTGGKTFHSILEKVYEEKMAWINQASSCEDAAQQLDDVNLSEIDIIHGHFPYGLHDLLPDEFEYSYITFLRHPFERLLSMHAYLADTFPDMPDFLSWIDSKNSAELDNGMARLLCNGLCITNDTDFSDTVEEKHVLEVLNNLSTFSFIGTTETYSKSLLNLAAMLKWEYLPLVDRIHAYPNRRHIADLTPQERTLLHNRFMYDLIIWEEVNSKIKNNTYR